MAECRSIDSLIMANQKHWTGHIMCKEDQRLPKCLFCGEQLHGKCAQNTPRKYYKDNIKDILKSLKIDILGWEKLALKRSE